MSYRIASISSAALIALAAFSSNAFAAEPAGAVYGAGTVGAMHNESRNVATTGGDVRGAATAATVRWTRGPQGPVGAYYGSGAVGAMVRESAGVATSASAVALQGGGTTAGTVRWVSTPKGS